MEVGLRYQRKLVSEGKSVANRIIISTKEQLKEWLSYEHQVYGNIKGLRLLFGLGEQAILWKHQTLLRKAEYYTNNNKTLMSLFYRTRLNKMQTKYALHIPLNCCGKGFKIMHVGPLLINEKAIIGCDCVAHMNVAIVAGGTDDYAPVLGNNIVVGYGAVILGHTTIADGVAVGTNAVVNRDVLEPGIAVAGVPAKKISNHGRSYWAKNDKSITMS